MGVTEPDAIFDLFLTPCQNIFVLIQHQNFQLEKTKVLSAFPTWVWRAGPRCETARQMWPSASRASSPSILPYSFCRSPRAAPGVFCTASSLFSISHHITAAPASSPATGYTSSDPQLTPSPSFSGYSLTLMPCFVGPGSKLEGALALRGSQTLALCSALLRVCVLDEPELPVPVC